MRSWCKGTSLLSPMLPSLFPLHPHKLSSRYPSCPTTSTNILNIHGTQTILIYSPFSLLSNLSGPSLILTLGTSYLGLISDSIAIFGYSCTFPSQYIELSPGQKSLAIFLRISPQGALTGSEPFSSFWNLTVGF